MAGYLSRCNGSSSCCTHPLDGSVRTSLQVRIVMSSLTHAPVKGQHAVPDHPQTRRLMGAHRNHSRPEAVESSPSESAGIRSRRIVSSERVAMLRLVVSVASSVLVCRVETEDKGKTVTESKCIGVLGRSPTYHFGLRDDLGPGVPTLIPSNAHRTGTGTGTVQVQVLIRVPGRPLCCPCLASLASNSLEIRTWRITSGERLRGCVRETLKPLVAYL